MAFRFEHVSREAFLVHSVGCAYTVNGGGDAAVLGSPPCRVLLHYLIRSGHSAIPCHACGKHCKDGHRGLRPVHASANNDGERVVIPQYAATGLGDRVKAGHQGGCGNEGKKWMVEFGYPCLGFLGSSLADFNLGAARPFKEGRGRETCSCLSEQFDNWSKQCLAGPRSSPIS